MKNFKNKTNGKDIGKRNLFYMAIVLLVIVLWAGGCNDVPFKTEIGKKEVNTNTTAFAPVEITISGIGTSEMAASAKPAVPDVAYTLTKPGGSGGPSDGTIELQPISNGSFTRGIRGSGGVRYIYATFKVRNSNIDGNVYPTNRENLTFLAVDNAGTLGLTAVAELRLFDGIELSGAAAGAIAEKVIPTGRVEVTADGGFVPVIADVLQVLSEAEAAAISVPAGVDVFPYGFITRGLLINGKRILPAPPPNIFSGLVTFAFKIPLQASAAQDPFEITMLFLPVDNSETKIMQPIELQTEKGARQIAISAAELDVEYVTIFPGSTYGGAAQVHCNPVRIAGTDASPTTELFAPLPGFTSLSPDPYADDGSAGNIPGNTSFTATFTGPVTVNGPLNRRLVVRGRQSGLSFPGGGFSGNGTATITSPAGSFFPGETVEVSRIRGFGGCAGTVARYRVEVTAGTGSFGPQATFAAGANPYSVALGDVNGDGALDMAAANTGTDDLSVMLGDGAGGFTPAPGSPFAVGNAPRSVALGDMNGDGALDMAAANTDSDDLSVLLGDGAGGFTRAAGSPFAVAGTNPRRVALGDVNGDGALDMAAANSASGNLSVLLGDGAGGFSPAPGSPFVAGTTPVPVALGDVNGDGALDVVVGNVNPNNLTVLLGDGAGGFTEAPGSPFAPGNAPVPPALGNVHSVALGDVNGDGTLDMAVANGLTDDLSVLLGDGAGGFTPAPASPFGVVGSSPLSVALGDVNGDGILDMAAGNHKSDDLTVLLGDGTGGFAAPPGGLFDVGNDPRWVALGDINGDGALDIATANRLSDNLSVLLNQ